MYLKVEHAYVIIRQILILLISSTFRYTTLCERIEPYTAKIDYNQDIYVYICSFIKIV